MTTTPTNAQMELGFTRAQRLSPTTRRQRRLQRAAWWFNQMRHAVDHAFESAQSFSPRTSPIAPPTQTLLPNAYRQVRV